VSESSSTKSRVKAFIVHLAISGAAAGLLVLLFVKFWFPMPFFVADGGWEGMRLIVAVDVIIGPLLTLIVYNTKKTRAHLVKDLTVVALLQVTAMGLGLYTVVGKRPAAVIYADGSAYSYNADEAALFPPAYHELADRSEVTPFFGVIDLPDDVETRQELRREHLMGRVAISKRFEYLKTLGEGVRAELELSAGLPQMVRKDPEKLSKVEQWATEHGATPDDYFIIPVICDYVDFLVFIAKSDLTVKGWLSCVKLYST